MDGRDRKRLPDQGPVLHRPVLWLPRSRAQRHRPRCSPERPADARREHSRQRRHEGGVERLSQVQGGQRARAAPARA